MRVGDLMTTSVVMIGTETPLRDVAAILAERSISGLPVVSERGIVLGVVSEADILAKERGPLAPRGRIMSFFVDHDRAELEQKLEARTAGEAMTAPAVTIGPKRPVAAAAALMIDRRVNRLPVVDEHGKLVGIVTRADLVRAFTRSDDEIVQEIQKDIVQRTLWLPAGAVEVTSHRGQVTLDGRLERRFDGELLPALVRRVPGVVSVTSKLTWPKDTPKGEPPPSWIGTMAGGLGARGDDRR
jgi:CBS domain-containing protein